MFSNLSPRTLQRAFAIQGIKIRTSDSPQSPLPIFTISNRRTVTDQRITVLEEGSVTDEFEYIDGLQNQPNIPDDNYAIVLRFEITSDFWMGYGNMTLSDTAVLVHQPDEELVRKYWDETDNELSPVLEFPTYKLTRYGREPLEN